MSLLFYRALISTMQRAVDEETKKRPTTPAERAEAKARNRMYKNPGRRQLGYMVVVRRERRRATMRMWVMIAALLMVVIGIALGIAFGTTKTTGRRTVRLAGVILSAEVLLLVVPFSFYLVGFFYMDRSTQKYAHAALVGWPLAFQGAAAATIYAAVRLIKS
jgi:hypothetical protein